MSKRNVTSRRETAGRKTLAVFFTFNVSLERWQQTGLLDRELKLYLKMIEQGWRVVFFTYGNAHDCDILKHEGLEIVPMLRGVPASAGPLRALVQSFVSVLRHRRYLKSVDVIKSNQVIGSWLARFAAIISGIPLLVRGGYEPLQFSQAKGESILKRAIISLTSRFSYRGADEIMLATKQDKDFVARTYGISPEKINVIGNWIDTDLFRPRAAEKFSTDTIFYIGRYDDQKNFPALVAAVASKKLKLHIAGNCPPEVISLIEDAGIEYLNRGVVANDDLPDILARYEIFCIPSFFEGNPKTLLEAMACGLTVVGSNGPGIADILEQIEGSFICGHDPQSIASMLDEAQSAPARRKQFGASARAFIVAHHSLNAFIEEEGRILTRLMRRQQTSE